MDFKRAIIPVLEQAVAHYPVATIVGPRQAGKTTLVRTLFPHKPYVNLEDPDVRAFAENDARGFMAQFAAGAIIDEIQHVPKLLSYIQVIVDEKQQNGLYILTGSQQLDLNAAITQSLAGRTALISLLPLSITELRTQAIDLDINDYLLKGFLPRTYAQGLNPRTAYRNYVGTYLERDIRKITKVHNLSLFQKFLKLCASRVGQVFNRESLANDVGVSAVTVTNWLAIMEASYLVFRIQPYYENFGKRVIKAPKLYFFDVGLLSYLLDIESTVQMARDPLRGYMIENLVVLELVKARFNQGLDHNLYYFRDNYGNEVDLIYKRAAKLMPIEIKSANSFDRSFLKGLQYFKRIAGDRVSQAWLVSAGEYAYEVNDCKLINIKQASQIVTAR